ncbi:rCG48960, partial [Rattus norvegicus]
MLCVYSALSMCSETPPTEFLFKR